MSEKVNRTFILRVIASNSLLKIGDNLGVDIGVALASDVALIAHLAVGQALGTRSASHNVSF